MYPSQASIIVFEKAINKPRYKNILFSTGKLKNNNVKIQEKHKKLKYGLVLCCPNYQIQSKSLFLDIISISKMCMD